MTKPYTLEEVREVLKTQLNNTKHIMTLGTIGSCNIEHDIDLIITKKSLSSSADFYKEVHGVFDSLEVYLLKKYGARVIRFATMQIESFMEYLSEVSSNDLKFHTMIYTSYPMIEKDWAFSLAPRVNLKEVLLEYSLIFGKKDDLFSEDFQKEHFSDHIFTYLYFGDFVNSHLLEDFQIQAMNSLFDYLYRKRLGLKAPVVKNVKEIRKYFYQLCEAVDEADRKYLNF